MSMAKKHQGKSFLDNSLGEKIYAFPNYLMGLDWWGNFMYRN